MKGKYPAKLFWVGFAGGIVFRRFYLFIPAVILLIIGIWVKLCLVIGFALMLIDVLISFIDQLQIRKTMLTESDNSDFNLFREAVLLEGWEENVRNVVDQVISEDDE